MIKWDLTGMNILLTWEYPLKPSNTNGLQSYEHLNTPLDHNTGHTSKLLFSNQKKVALFIFHEL